jgi:putative nucleotidyltransferase-like protein
MIVLAQAPIALVLASARLVSDTGAGPSAEVMVEEERVWLTDWNRLLVMAAAHGMRPLLCRFLVGQTVVCPQPEQTKACSKLQEFTQRNLRKNLRMTGELIILIRMFAEHGVNIIPFKGPTLAALAYGDLGLREFGDLDLLIAKTDFLKAKELLIARGYQPEVTLNARQAAVFAEACNVMAFWHPEKEISVELHWELSPKYLPFSPDPERLRERMVPSHPGGQAVMTLSPEDLLVYLCAHGAKHVWEKLIWIADVAGLIHRHSNLDWRRVYDLAVEQRCERVLFLGLRLACDMTGVSAPPKIEKLMESDPESGRLAAKIIDRLLSDSTSRSSPSADSLFIYRMQRRWPDKIRSLARMAITPSAADWLSYPKLRRFPWAYSLLRPLRLMSKLVRGSASE